MIDTATFVSSWSGGKDSCFAFMQAVQNGSRPKVLLNMLNENGRVSRSHAITRPVLERQAQALGVPLLTAAASWADYEAVFIRALHHVVAEFQVNTAVFGDIDLQAHRDWEEKVCHAVGITAWLPLWQQNRKDLVLHMLGQGVKAHIVSCNEVMGEHFLGRLLDVALVEELEALGIDACGENGEYHTLVVDCPLFTQPVAVDFGAKNHHGQYWFIETC